MKKFYQYSFLIVLIVIVVALVGTLLTMNSYEDDDYKAPVTKSYVEPNSTENKKQNEIEENYPDEVALITYAETIIEDEFGDANFVWAEYYNVVPPEYSLRSKVEGFVKINGIEHEFTVIFEFEDEQYKYYNALYLQVDDLVMYDYR